MKRAFLDFLTVFSASGTLVCCALPALFVSLGMGATFVGLLSKFPQLIFLSENKGAIFAIAGILIVVSVALHIRSKSLACPIDQKEAEACERTRVRSQRILVLSTVLYLVGGFFAFVAPYIL